MPSLLTSLVYPLAAVVFSAFVLIRFRFFTDRDLPGRSLALSGAICLVAAAVWQSVKGLEGYHEWFLAGAYSYFDIIQVLVFLAGSFLLAAGLILFADYWQLRKESLSIHEQKLTILATIQRDARDPYHLLELLDLALKEIVSHLSSTAGAVFLINRKSRQFVLAAQAGLTRDETAAFERYPFQRNLLSQTIEIGESLITGSFQIPGTGSEDASRFRNSLILPLISGSERIGGIVLLSEEPGMFGNSEVRYLEPVAEWLAEKIKSSRLTRELGRVKKESEEGKRVKSEEISLLKDSLAAVAQREPIKAFCSRLAGLAGSNSAHVCTLSAGTLQIIDGSEPLIDISENYKTALVDAIGRHKPLIINQEVIADDSRQQVALSSLVLPIPHLQQPTALLLRQESAPFKIGESELEQLDLMTGMAAMIMKLQQANRTDISRKLGFEQITRMLQLKNIGRFEDEPEMIGQTMQALLPEDSEVITFVRNDGGLFVSIKQLSHSDERLSLAAGEGALGLVSTDLKPSIAAGRKEVNALLNSFGPHNMEALKRSFGERDLPDFSAVFPVVQADLLVGAVEVFVWTVNETQQKELERLLTLAVGMYNVALAVNHLRRTQMSQEVARAGISGLGEIVNQINNRLAAVIGQAELASARDDISGEVRQQFLAVIAESERTAEYVRQTLTEAGAGARKRLNLQKKSATIEDVIDAALAGIRISDDLYMVNGRTREIISKISPATMDLKLQGSAVHLFGKALAHFSDLTLDDEVISVETYIDDDYLYLDISRHRKNFPSVDRVAGFGLYQIPSEVLKARPQDAFLSHVSDDCAFSFDRYSETPSYLSFKFPYSAAGERGSKVGGLVNVLAVDDQPIILDLLRAMCQTLEYRIETATNGATAITLAENQEFDIVLTDLAMPGLSGLETARRIREIQPHTPIILLTGWEATIEQAELDSSGITEVLYKPFRIEQLTEIIRKRIAQRATI